MFLCKHTLQFKKHLPFFSDIYYYQNINHQNYVKVALKCNGTDQVIPGISETSVILYQFFKFSVEK